MKSLIAKKEINPRYFNSIALRAIVKKDCLKKINPNNISLSLGSNLHSVSYPINNSNQFNFVSIFRKKLTFKKLSNYSLFNNRDFISSVLSDISKQIDPDIVKNLKNISCFPIFVSSEIHKPINKNTFIIGDAFFAFPPTFAQGASQSIEVAHEIFRNLENKKNQFISERIKRTKMINIKSKFNYFVFHLSNPLIIWFINILMKYLVKDKKFINSYLGKIYKD
jgi:salicylate hydroxylase